MERFHLKVVASDKVFFDGSTEVAIVPALDGEYAFMAHHEALVVAVQPGRLSYKKRTGHGRMRLLAAALHRRRTTV